ncbi:MAG: hypothetical protein VB817_09650 [Pirellulaceae bacterium]
MMQKVVHPCRALLFLLVGLLVTPATMAQQASQLADQFSSTLDQRRGLCVYLGNTDTALPLLLCDGGKHIVNILTPDSEMVQVIRARIAEQQLLGMVTAEQVSLGHLPHSTNMVNLVVVDQLGQ